MNLYDLGEYLVERQNALEKRLVTDEEEFDQSMARLVKLGPEQEIDVSIYPTLYAFDRWTNLKNRFFYVFSGHMELTIGRQPLMIEPGNILYLRENTTYHIEPIRNGTIVVLVDVPDAYDLEKLCLAIDSKKKEYESPFRVFCNQLNQDRFMLIESSKLDDPAYIFERLICECLNNDIFGKLAVESFLNLCLVEIFRGGFYTPQKKHLRQATATIDEFLEYIDVHYQRTDLKKMAIFFGYNPNYLSNCMKKATGKSFMELIQIKKMSVAAILLENPEITTEEISEYLGYASSSFFYKKFKDFFHVSPAEMREICRKRN